MMRIIHESRNSLGKIDKRIKNKIMKKVSARLFFSVLGRGLYQVAQWVVNLCWNKKNGVIAKFVWTVLATSAAVVMEI